MRLKGVGLPHVGRRWLVIGLTSTLILVGICLIITVQYVNVGQAGTIVSGSSITTFIEGSSSVVKGNYQASGGSYDLWSYRTDTLFRDANRCDSKDDGNDIPRQSTDITIPGYFDGQGVWHPPRYCENRNGNPGDRTNYAENLNHDWNQWGLTSSGLLDPDFQPFLVIGDTGSEGIQNEELSLDIWMPAETTAPLEIEAYDLCNQGSTWDLRTSSGLDSIVFEGLDKTKSQPIECDGNQNTIFTIPSPIKSTLGPPIEKKGFITNRSNFLEDEPYQRYKLTVKTPGRCNTCASYTNQFRLKMTKPDRSYLTMPETDSADVDEPKNAVGMGMRLPDHLGNTSSYTVGDNVGFVRLEVLWEVEILAATDPEEGCASGGIHGRIGLYDHDYPRLAQGWTKNGAFPPSLEIQSTPRNPYLEDGSETWTTVPIQGNMVHQFGINPTQQGNASNKWDSELYKEFESDKIYRFRFFNIDQRNWVQIGIPFDQANALQKCIGNPIVKVYHGDVSVGGWFGKGKLSKACRGEDPASLTNSQKGRIYGHAALVGDGNNGSSAEYAVYARDEIDSFYSGYKKPPPYPPPVDPPDPANRLTFANSSGEWGGFFGDELRCIPNWWRRTEHLPVEDENELWLNQPSGLPLGQDLERFYRPDSGQLSLSVSNPHLDSNLDLKAAIYVDGDLLIKENIINENNGLEKLNQLKSIYFIVQGDILIEPNVTQIDAILIAIPTDDAQTQDGRIFTCYVSGVTDGTYDYLHYDPVTEVLSTDLVLSQHQDHDHECRERLVINGALIARQIRLGRVTNPTLNYYDLNEGPVTEEINLLPEYFVGTPLLPTHADWYYSSDSVTILPVNF